MRVRDFLRVGCQHRPAKSRKGHRRTPERRSVLHAQLAKVELTEFSEVHLSKILGTSLSVELLLDHRFGWLSSGYRVSV